MGMLKLHAQKGAFMYVYDLLRPGSYVDLFYKLANGQIQSPSADIDLLTVLKALKIVTIKQGA